MKNMLEKLKYAINSIKFNTKVLKHMYLITLILLSNLLGYFVLYPLFIKKNAKLIVSSVENMYKEEQAKAENESKKKVPVVFDSIISESCIPFIGNKDAASSKTIVEFFDYQCPHCKNLSENIDKLKKEDKNIKVYLLNIPSSQGSFVASNFGLFIFKKYGSEKFEKFNKIIINSKSIDKISIDKAIKEIGLNAETILNEMKENEDLKDCMQKINEYARMINLTGTPYLIINKKAFPGYLSVEQLKSLTN